MRSEISVIMAAYNAEKYLESALNSIIRQTFKNWELIFVDDGSTDGTVSILKRVFSHIDNPITYLRTDRVGPARARLRGISEANGNYIAIMDSDDYSLPSRFAVQKAFLEENNLDICGSNVFVFGATYPRFWNFPQSVHEVNVLSLFNSPIANPVAFGRVSTFKSNGLININAPAEDYKMWSYFIEKNKLIGNVNKVLLAYRIHPNQISSSKRSTQAQARTAMAKTNWLKHGIDLKLSSFHRISTYDEVTEIANAVNSLNLNFPLKGIAKYQIWKMILRSELDRRKLIRDFTVKDIKFSINQKIVALILIIFNYVPR